MRISSLTIAAAWLSSLGAGLAVPETHVIHEQRSADAGSHLKRRSKPDHSIQLPMRIGLKQSNLDKAPQWLMDVSHPGSDKYGKHWTSEEVIEAFKPSDKTIESVKQWLKDNGIAEQYVVTPTLQRHIITRHQSHYAYRQQALVRVRGYSGRSGKPPPYRVLRARG